MIDSLEVSQILIVGHIRQCISGGNLTARSSQYVYYTDKAITFLLSAYPQLPFHMNIALVQTRYRCDRLPQSFPNFHFRPYTAVYWWGYLDGLQRPVQLFQRQGDYNFSFCIPTATFPYKHCFGANTVQL